MEMELTLKPVNTSYNTAILLSEQNKVITSRSLPEIIVKSPFIEANTESVSLTHLKEKFVIPVFTKDNEITLSHQEFIETAISAIATIFPNEPIDIPEIRVSHQIKGRTPDALHIAAKDLGEHQRTSYFERMAFIIRVPGITETINGN
jgi:hypothetical protein